MSGCGGVCPLEPLIFPEQESRRSVSVWEETGLHLRRPALGGWASGEHLRKSRRLGRGGVAFYHAEQVQDCDRQLADYGGLLGPGADDPFQDTGVAPRDQARPHGVLD